MPQFRSRDLEKLFDQVLGQHWHTQLRGGAEEPFYAPAEPGEPAVIHYTRDYFRSALHEVAHWCVAGERRRQLPDFGYWYAPDGRDDQAQSAFEKVERAPQALEWIFCAACDHAFCVSLDNLSGDTADAGPFERAVRARALAWLEQDSLPARAGVWVDALYRQYRGGQGRVDATLLDRVFMPL